ncbi:phosphoketolase [Nocardia sp. NPDC060249]|uniref:phosphoketolase family protein n=1 Tax=Nocardia sp. NPDC060249 TaxID=3347082 RepID=UPI003664504F
MSDWAHRIADIAAAVATDEVDVARRALDYLCLAQLYLADNITLSDALSPEHVKASPAGHWGVCPPVNAVLAALGPYRQLSGTDVRVVHGGGHAGPSALAQAWIAGLLDTGPDGFGHSADGLRRLCAQFPRTRFGSEITPLIPGHDHVGGQLGPALAISHGMALDSPDRLVVTLIGDGECETGATAAAWLGAHALIGTGGHGRVLPVVLANGLRMGGTSLLAGLGAEALEQYLGALGYRVITAGQDSGEIITAMASALAGLAPLQHGPSTVLVVTVDKGHGVPETVGGTPVAKTPRVHKVPLRDPAGNAAEFAALQQWLAGYRPGDLFTADAAPSYAVAKILTPARRAAPTAVTAPRRCLAASRTAAERVAGQDFGAGITRTLRDLNSAYGLRVFSPDELTSNRLDLASPSDAEWIVEVLNEELCHAWAQGYQMVGHRALVAGYEAFAPITASLLAQQMITHRLAVAAGHQPTPGPTYLLTSLGWHNTISHANPSMVDVAIGLADPTVHVYMPADAPRAAAACTFAVRKLGRASLIIASKHPMPEQPRETLDAELADGYAIWPHIADDPHPDLVLVSIGDLAARELCLVAAELLVERPGARVRYVHVHDLSCLGAPGQRDAAIDADTFDLVFPTDTPILVAAICRSAPVHALFGERGASRTITVRGWVDPPYPMNPTELLEHTGVAAASLGRTARKLLDHYDRQGVR